MKQIQKSIFFMLALTIVLSGCFNSYDYSKTITNDSEYPVKVSFACCGGGEDKVFTIASQETVLIHECIYQGPGKSPDCGESPLSFSVSGAADSSLEAAMEDAGQWEYNREGNSINCNFVIRQDFFTITKTK